MKVDRKKWVISTLFLGAVVAGGAIYYQLNSKTVEEYKEHYTKEWAKLLNQKDEIAFSLKDSDQEPQELVNQWGRFHVKVKEVRPFLDGYKITFSVWNPSSITFPNPQVQLKWNHLRQQCNEDISKMTEKDRLDFLTRYQKACNNWSSSFKKKKFSNLKAIEAKSWTDLEFTILPCNPIDFEHVEFSIIG